MHIFQRAIKSVKFYKGEIDKLECMGFTSNVPCVEAANETKGDSDDGELCVQDFRMWFFFRIKFFVHILLSNIFIFKFSVTAKAKKAICVAFVSLLLSFFSCATVTFNYVEDIFKRTGSTSSKEYSLLISIVQLVANLIFLNIVERFKRRVSQNFIFFNGIPITHTIPLLYRLFTFGLRSSQRSAIAYMAHTAYYYFTSHSMNSFRWFALYASHSSAAWEWYPYRTS